MKTKIVTLLTSIMAISLTGLSQAPLKEIKVGHIFYISLPDYMSKTTGMNEVSAVEYKNDEKEVYGFVVEDNKEEMALLDVSFSSINEFYEDFIKDFVAGEKNRTVSTPKYQKKGDISFAETDLTYYDKEAKMDIYYLVGIVETKTSFYKVLSWSAAANKAKFKADFQKILYSLKD